MLPRLHIRAYTYLHRPLSTVQISGISFVDLHWALSRSAVASSIPRFRLYYRYTCRLRAPLYR